MKPVAWGVLSVSSHFVGKINTNVRKSPLNAIQAIAPPKARTRPGRQRPGSASPGRTGPTPSCLPTGTSRQSTSRCPIISTRSG